jgi:WYL_2, Sm-like SH3 beta-barrel fold
MANQTDSVETFLTLMSDVKERNKYLTKLLKNNECEITFIKINGEKRVMPCTLMADRLPVMVNESTDKKRKSNPETISAFCTDKDEWRSFRVMNVVDVKILP